MDQRLDAPSDADQAAKSTESSAGSPGRWNAEGLDIRSEIEELQHRLALLAARLPTSSRNGGEPLPPVEPEMDIYENDQEFFIFAAMPGIAPQDIKIDASPHSVSLSAEGAGGAPAGTTQEGRSSSRRHRCSRFTAHERYHFVYTLHAAINPDAVRASFRHGMVEIHLPKARTAHRPVRIPVRVSEERMGMGLPAPSAQSSPPYEMNTVSPLPVRSHEGNPSHKLGQVYVPNAGEDHSTKAQSIGERSQRTGTALSVAARRGVGELSGEPDDPATMEARSTGHKL